MWVIEIFIYNIGVQCRICIVSDPYNKWENTQGTRKTRERKGTTHQDAQIIEATDNTIEDMSKKLRKYMVNLDLWNKGWYREWNQRENTGSERSLQ